MYTSTSICLYGYLYLYLLLYLNIVVCIYTYITWVGVGGWAGVGFGCYQPSQIDERKQTAPTRSEHHEHQLGLRGWVGGVAGPHLTTDAHDARLWGSTKERGHRGRKARSPGNLRGWGWDQGVIAGNERTVTGEL